MHASRLLLTNDAADLRRALSNAFPNVELSYLHGEHTIEWHGEPAICFIDWLTPDTSGIALCRYLRSNPATAHAHITMVLDDDVNGSRKRALLAGADDYILGPLEPDKLVTRIRRYFGDDNRMRPAARMTIDGLTVDHNARLARYNGTVVDLRPTEFELLAHFMENPDQLFARAQLIHALGKDAGCIDERTVDVWIGRLRRSLQRTGMKASIRTVRNLGYVLDSPPTTRQ